DPGRDDADPAVRYLPPRSEEEARLAAIWAQALGLPAVGVTDDFFLLGGRSLLIPRLLFLVGQSFGVELPVRILFEAPTVERMVRAIQSASVTDGAPERRVSDRVDRLSEDG